MRREVDALSIVLKVVWKVKTEVEWLKQLLVQRGRHAPGGWAAQRGGRTG